MASVWDLDVYRRSVEPADELRACVVEWTWLDQRTVGLQLIRTADSVGANIAEGNGRQTPPDQRHFLFIARGSSLELRHWLRRAEARRLSLPEQAVPRAELAGRLLNGLIRSRPKT